MPGPRLSFSEASQTALSCTGVVVSSERFIPAARACLRSEVPAHNLFERGLVFEGKSRRWGSFSGRYLPSAATGGLRSPPEVRRKDAPFLLLLEFDQLINSPRSNRNSHCRRCRSGSAASSPSTCARRSTKSARHRLPSD